MNDEKQGSPGTADATTCRRCSECQGENHHWIEHCEPPEVDDGIDTGFAGYACKHCDARAEMCDDCTGVAEPGHVCEWERAERMIEATDAAFSAGYEAGYDDGADPGGRRAEGTRLDEWRRANPNHEEETRGQYFETLDCAATTAGIDEWAREDTIINTIARLTGKTGGASYDEVQSMRVMLRGGRGTR